MSCGAPSMRRITQQWHSRIRALASILGCSRVAGVTLDTQDTHTQHSLLSPLRDAEPSALKTISACPASAPYQGAWHGSPAAEQRVADPKNSPYTSESRPT